MLPVPTSEDRWLNMKLALATVEEHKTLPDPGVEWKERLEAAKAANLTKQHEAVLFEMRVWQAKQLGFLPATEAECVALLMGEPHTEIIASTEHQPYKWVFFHDTGEIRTDTNWGFKPETFIKKSKKGPWYLPPFKHQEDWRVEVVMQPDQAKKTMPHHVVVGLAVLRKLNLFNSYKVLQSSKDECLLVANIWELPPTEKGERPTSSSRSQQFALARF